MRPRSSKLLLLGAVPLAISGCSDSEQHVTYTVQHNFKGVPACAAARVPLDLCSEAYFQAMIDHHRVAPIYDDQAACDADFVEGYCQLTSDGKYMPSMAGFELATSGELPRSQFEQAELHAQQHAARFGGTERVATGILAGVLIGNAMSSRSAPRYRSRPIYQNRDSRGIYQASTLARQIEQGKTFSRAIQPPRNQERDEQTSGSGGYGSGGSSRSGSASTFRSGTNGSSISSSLSRGGFGQQATARSGWGGKSSGVGG